MRRRMCRSKIHRATVTDANLAYEGSITLDPVLMAAADILEYEQVHVVNIANGARFATYAITGVEASGDVVLNGAAARLVQPGDKVIIMAYGDYEAGELDDFAPRLVFVDDANRIRERPPQEDPGAQLRIEPA